MATNLPQIPERRAGRLSPRFSDKTGLPFVDVLTAERITRVFAKQC